jgi:transcription factor S
MEFCPKCGSLLVMKKTKFGCPRCNYTPKNKVVIKTKEVLKNEMAVGIIKDKNENLPITDYKCPKCKNKKAYFWTRQMDEEGEAESEFYKCTKCGNTTREDNF